IARPHSGQLYGSWPASTPAKLYAHRGHRFRPCGRSPSKAERLPTSSSLAVPRLASQSAIVNLQQAERIQPAPCHATHWAGRAFAVAPASAKASAQPCRQGCVTPPFPASLRHSASFRYTAPMRRRFRPLLLLALLLLAGAVVSVGVAWALVGAPDSWT